MLHSSVLVKRDSLLKCKNLIELTAEESTLRGKDCGYVDIGTIGSSIISKDAQGPDVPQDIPCPRVVRTFCRPRGRRTSLRPRGHRTSRGPR